MPLSGDLFVACCGTYNTKRHMVFSLSELITLLFTSSHSGFNQFYSLPCRALVSPPSSTKTADLVTWKGHRWIQKKHTDNLRFQNENRWQTHQKEVTLHLLQCFVCCVKGWEILGRLDCKGFHILTKYFSPPTSFLFFPRRHPEGVKLMFGRPFFGVKGPFFTRFFTQVKNYFSKVILVLPARQLREETKPSGLWL